MNIEQEAYKKKQTQYKLIKIPEQFIIVSDEDIKEGNNYICISSMYVKKCIKKDNNKIHFWVEDYLGNQDQLKFSSWLKLGKILITKLTE